MGKEAARIKKMYETETEAVKQLLEKSKEEQPKLQERLEKLQKDSEDLKDQYNIA